MHFNLHDEYRFVRIGYKKSSVLNDVLGIQVFNTVQFNITGPYLSLEVVTLKCVDSVKVAYVGESDKKYDAFIFEDNQGNVWFNQYPLFFQPDSEHLYPVSVSNNHWAAALRGKSNSSLSGTAWMTEITSYQAHLENHLVTCDSKDVAIIQRLKGEIDHLLNDRLSNNVNVDSRTVCTS